MTEPPFDADDQDLLAQAVRGLQDDLPDDARMRRLERLVAPVLLTAPPARWWERGPARLAGGAAILAALGGAYVATRAPSTSPPPAITTPAVVPTAPEAAAKAPLAPSPLAPATPVVSVDALPAATLAPPRPGSVAGRAPDAPAREAAPAADPGDELSLLEEARHALVSDPARALSLAEAHGKRFPTPAFAQERERVAIDALVRLGHRPEAEARAKAFEATYPGSAHLARVRALVAPRAVP